MHTYIHTYIHRYIDPYIHRYIDTYVHISTLANSQKWWTRVWVFVFVLFVGLFQG